MTAATKTIRLTVSPEAERYVRRDAPLKTRKMAATGAMPLPPVELATVLFVLMNDPDPEIKETARESLANLPEAVSHTILTSETHSAVLGALAHLNFENEAQLEKIALNPATDDATIAFLATLPFKATVEIIANNQERLLRAPAILDALGGNPLTGRATIERVLSFLGLRNQENGTDESGDEDLSNEEAEAALLAILGSDAKDLIKQLASEDAAITEEVKGSLFFLISKMTVVQKIKLAMLGNKEARSILVRDNNKIVSSAAIRSPKVTDHEAESYAKSRQLSEEVIRVIANNREWTKNYQVKSSLVNNPKCPVPLAMKLLPHLHERDLRAVAKSKDVTAPIINQAKRLLAAKGKR